MFRRFAIGLTTAAFFANPAIAYDIVLFRSPDVKVDWGHKNLAAVKCEDPKTISEMEASILAMQWPKGERAFGPQDKVKIFRSRTMTATANRLVCRITMTVGIYSVSGRFRVEIRGGGKWDIYFADHD